MRAQLPGPVTGVASGSQTTDVEVFVARPTGAGTPRLYDDLAHLWPLVSPAADCAAEAERVRALLHQYGAEGEPIRRRSLLELGVGAGQMLGHLTDEFDAVGVDASAAMLAHSRAANPTVTHHLGDFRDIRLGRSFDAVVAVDALDYMVTEADLRAAVATAAAHLDPGGLFLAATNYTSETFEEHEVAHDFHADGQTELTNLSYVHRHPSERGIELVVVLLVREAGVLRIEEDRQHCGLFPLATWRSVLADGGFDVVAEQVDDAGTWFVAVRQ